MGVVVLVLLGVRSVCVQPDTLRDRRLLVTLSGRLRSDLLAAALERGVILRGVAGDSMSSFKCCTCSSSSSMLAFRDLMI